MRSWMWTPGQDTTTHLHWYPYDLAKENHRSSTSFSIAHRIILLFSLEYLDSWVSRILRASMTSWMALVSLSNSNIPLIKVFLSAWAWRHLAERLWAWSGTALSSSSKLEDTSLCLLFCHCFWQGVWTSVVSRKEGQEVQDYPWQRRLLHHYSSTREHVEAFPKPLYTWSPVSSFCWKGFWPRYTSLLV